MQDRYAVVGNPIAHSLSPMIHHEFAKQTHQSISYEKILAPIDEFTKTIADFFKAGGKGLNITAPFKLQAAEFADQLTERAKLAGSVNTLIPMNAYQYLGDNTDGIGLVRDLTHLNWPLNHANILILGAGGATRGIIHPLLAANVSQIIIANRTLAKAEELIKLWDTDKLSACSLEQIPAIKFDLIIQATSAHFQEQAVVFSDTFIQPNSYVYDLSYGKTLTPFLQWAKPRAYQVMDGLGMLVEQAAEAFYLWRGIRPETKHVLQYLRTNL